MDDKKIKDMIRKVAERKTEISELRGEKTQILKQMKDEGCESLEDIEKELAKENKKIQKLSSEVEEAVENLEKDFEWN